MVDTTETTMLEVIVCDAADAKAATTGGADRLELIAVPEHAGFTPTVETFRAVRAATDLPIRVMLRSEPGFTSSNDRLAEIASKARELRRAGATQFVLGFLDGSGDLDTAAIQVLLDAAQPDRWTLHHAFDHARNPEQAWRAASPLPHLDLVLSGGGPQGLGRCWPTLCARAGWQEAGLRWLAGGGLAEPLVRCLTQAGITQIHAGRVARGRWGKPVAETAVRRLKLAAQAY